MKKIFTFCAAAVMAVSMFAGNYGILVNGKTYFAGTQTDEFEGFTQYLAHVQVKAGDKCQLYDADNKAAWAVNINTASVAGFTLDGDHYNVSADGCYDFYIKLKYGADELYIGSGSNCGSGTDISGQGGGGQGGGQGGGGNAGADEYWYWKGYVDGKDIESEVDGGLFDGGMSEIVVKNEGYIFVMHQIHGVPGEQYMASTLSDATHCTMSKSGGEKLKVPAGTHTLYLYDNGDGTVELSREQLPGKKLMDTGGGNQAIGNTAVTEQAHKVIIDGVLYIRMGGKLYDIQGQQVNK